MNASHTEASPVTTVRNRPGMKQHTESEFKLRAQQPIKVALIDAALHELGQNCRLSDARRHTDTYLDDERSSLLQNGIGLRLRAGGGKRLLTCKARRRDDGALFVRDEIEVPWAAEELPGLARELPDELRSIIQPIVGERALLTQQVLTVHREIRMLSDGSNDLCELAIDFVTATANDRSAKFQEIELEVCNNLPANEQLANELQKRLPVDFAEDDKPSHAATLLEIEIPADLAAEELAGRPIGELIPEQLQAILSENSELEDTVRDVGHRSTVQQMQHGLERMECLVWAFRDLWERSVHERLRSHLRTTQRQLSTVRDLHFLVDNMRIHAQSLPTQLHDAGSDAVIWAERERDTAMDRLSEWLGDQRRKVTCDEFAADIIATSPESEQAKAPFLPQATTRLAATIASLRSRLAATDSDPLPADALDLSEQLRSALHLCEHFGNLAPMSYKKSAKAIARVLRHVDHASSLDTAVASMLQRDPGAANKPDEPSSRTAAIGGLATLHHEAAKEARAVAQAALERLDREQVWRRFPVDPPATSG